MKFVGGDIKLTYLANCGAALASQNAPYIPLEDVQKCAVGVVGDCGLGFL